MKVFKHIKAFMALGVFLLVLSTSAFAVVTIKCIWPQVQCCPGGVQSCCDPLSGNQTYDVSCFIGGTGPVIGPIDDPIIPGGEIYSNGDKKYTPSGCSDTVETYCYGSWCSGNITCPSCTSTSQSRSCSGNVTNATGGTQYRYRTVTSGCSSCSYGSWGSYTGTCTCKSGYTWSGSACNKTCTTTCSGNYFLDKGNCRCCRKTCLWGGVCDCTNGSYLLSTNCCTIRVSSVNHSEVPICCGYQSCDEMATALGGTLTSGPYICSKM